MIIHFIKIYDHRTKYYFIIIIKNLTLVISYDVNLILVDYKNDLGKNTANYFFFNFFN